MRPLSAFVLHVTAASVMALGWLSFLETDMAKLIMTQKGGHSQFLTHHGLVSAWSCMVVGLFCDVFPSVKAVRHLKKTLLMISMPLAFTISSTYWSLLLFLPNLITPPAPVSRLPLTIDLAVHASPLIALSTDFFVFESKFSETYAHRVAPVAAVVLSAWYASHVEYCATLSGSFPYPFLTHSPFATRILIYTITGATALGCFRTLNTLHV